MVPNKHLVKVSFLGPTDYKGSRVKLTSMRFEKNSVTISKDYQFNSSIEQAVYWLEKNGYKPLFVGELPKGEYMVVCDEFNPLLRMVSDDLIM